MYKQESKYKLLTEIKDDFPFIKIGVKFRDYFTEDTYMLVSGGKTKNLKHIPFALYKNNEPIKECAMINCNIDKLLNDAFRDIEDHDLKKLFFTLHKDRITKEVLDFIEEYEKVVLMNEITLEGELRRMKEMAGIKKKLIY